MQPHRTATKVLSAIIALVVVASAMTFGGVAQPAQETNNSSAADDEPNDTPENATHIEYNETVDGTLSANDTVDYYAVNGSAGDGLITRLQLQRYPEDSTLQVDFVNPTDEVSFEHTGDLMGGMENRVGAYPHYRETTEALAADTMEYNDTYYVRVEIRNLNETAANDTFEYNLSAETTELDSHDPNENASTATQLGLGETVNGTITGYDHDVFAVNLTAGQNYTVDYDHTAGHGAEQSVSVWSRSPVDADEYHGHWTVENGQKVASTQSLHGSSATLNVSAETNGTHYVVVDHSGSSVRLLDKSKYGLTVTPQESSPADDAADGGDTNDDGDADDDGLTNERERELGTDPTDADTDGDGLTDGQEVELGSDPTWDNTYEDRTKDGVEDTDGDGLPDWLEQELGTDPTDPDTDDDGVEDDYEIRIGSDPTDPDTDDDGVSDSETYC